MSVTDYESSQIKRMRRAIPEVTGCPQGCTGCCGPVPFSRAEWERIADKREAPAPDGSCPYASARGCDIYTERPVLCRLYGLEGVPKEHDCGHELVTARKIGRQFNPAKVLRQYRVLIHDSGVYGPFADFYVRAIPGMRRGRANGKDI
jgi:Fe-S-cluster containining protein